MASIEVKSGPAYMKQSIYLDHYPPCQFGLTLSLSFIETAIKIVNCSSQEDGVQVQYERLYNIPSEWMYWNVPVRAMFKYDREHDFDIILGLVVTCRKLKWTFPKHSNDAVG